GVDYEPGAASDLRLIWFLSLNRNLSGVFGLLDVQGATEAEDADQRDTVVQHGRSFSATADGAKPARIDASGQPTLRPADKPSAHHAHPGASDLVRSYSLEA